MTFELRDRTVVLIGGGSGIGLAVARRVIADGARVVLGGRSRERLDGAVAELGPGATARAVDTADPASVEDFFADIDTVDALLTTAATYTVGSFKDLDPDAARSPFESKFWGQYRVVKAALPKFSADAAVVLVSGAASVRPAGPAAPYVAANAAIEGLARGLAVELAPVRVTAIAPGTVDGNLWAGRPDEARDAAFAHIRREAVLGRPGTEDEIAAAVVHLFTNTYTTGSTLYVDGGYALR
ncbi:SDR family oxidoreductase [Tsukamurella pseudospumae]|uniref:Short-chain dehydrogenase n=1 Tax=Tsukamurella pseudospumae TaxID=239498 RepID=A0A138AIZ7_9ACTN|nr:SDR family oxidoreductase [Tsukamurella pseudospumae]KXP00115.1 short-chain dehydrogenase [Tsukamurella pseudospumae]KXP10374.1 short-chain dehydrogenase [Tsukamurella pseudospumae]